VSHLGDDGDMVKVKKERDIMGNDLHGPHHDRNQINRWMKFKERRIMQVMDKIEQCQEDGRRRTGIDCKHNDRNHQDGLALVRTQDPSPPDNNAVGNNKLNQDSKRCISSQGMLVDGVRVQD
jgi:hypothetical protein